MKTLENSVLLLYILWDDWPFFMISGSNEQLQQQFEYTLLNPDCHSWWISKMYSNTLEERYFIKFCFKVGKCDRNLWNASDCFFLPSCMNRASVFEWHKRFKKGRESVRDDERCGRSKEVSTSELIGQRIRVLGWGFKGVQEKIPSEEASTLQIGSVEFPPGQCTSPQLHPCHRLFYQDRYQDSSSLWVQTLLPLSFGYSLSSEAVVMRQLSRWKRLWRRLATRSHKRTSTGPSRSCLNSTTSALQLEDITSKGNRVSCEYYQ